jgi:uncharacterized protein YkwD
MFVVVLMLTLVGLTAAGASLFTVWSRPRPVASAPREPDDPVRKAAPKEQRPGKETRSVVPDHPGPTGEDEGLAQRVLAAVNAQRRLAGRPELTLDPEQSAGCREHARYLEKNASRPDLDPHDQEPGFPGATPAGRKVAPSASVAWSEPVAAVNAWLAAPAHRAFLLEPSLRTVGFGFARMEARKWVSVFDWLGGRREERAPSGEVRAVVFPSPRQVDVPLAFPGNEVPDPLPHAKNKVAGYPVTATFPARAAVPSVEAWLEDETGGETPVWLSTPTRPANEAFARAQQNTVCLFAREPLRPRTRYVVLIQAEGVSSGGGKRGGDWSRVWSFTTASASEVNRKPYGRAVERLNFFRKAAGLGPVHLDLERSRACLAHARYLARHLDRTPSVRPNEELPDLPGFTEEGQSVAKRSAVRIGGGTGPVDAVDWLMASVLNRHLVLNPTMASLGLGAALHAPRGWVWVVHLAAQRSSGDGPLATVYPGDGQTNVPLYLGRELGELVAGQPKEAAAGFAVTANFFPGQRLTDVSASLADAEGREVACWLSTPEKPLENTGNYNQIILVPKKPLAPATRYTARFRAKVAGRPWTRAWSFRTTDPERYGKEVERILLDRVNRVREAAGLAKVTLDEGLSNGCRQHARYAARHLEHARLRGLGIHEQDPGLPGASAAGAKAGKASIIAVLSDPADSVDNWLATLYHRVPILEPELKRVGYGQVPHPTRGWVTVLDTGSGK